MGFNRSGPRIFVMIYFLGPLMFGFHDGQSEAPKIMAKKVKLLSTWKVCKNLAKSYLKGDQKQFL